MNSSISKSLIKKSLALAVTGGLVVQLSGCGTILYPERKGQVSGKLDVGVVALDAVGLLFFLIPGVIAFAVDFSNGTIYTPGTSASLDNPENMTTVRVDGELTDETIERIVKEQTGQDIRMKDAQVTEAGDQVSLLSIQHGVRYL